MSVKYFFTVSNIRSLSPVKGAVSIGKFCVEPLGTGHGTTNDNWAQSGSAKAFILTWSVQAKYAGDITEIAIVCDANAGRNKELASEDRGSDEDRSSSQPWGVQSASATSVVWRSSLFLTASEDLRPMVASLR